MSEQQQSRAADEERAVILARKLDRSSRIAARARLSAMVDREHRAEVAEVIGR